MKLDPLLEEHRKEIVRIAAKHGAKNVRAVGDYARGDQGPESAVELLVDTGPVLTPWFPGGLMSELGDLLGRDVYVGTEIHEVFRDFILKDAVPL